MQINLLLKFKGVPHTIFFSLGSLYVFNNTWTLLSYFYIITYFLKSKLGDINNLLLSANQLLLATKAEVKMPKRVRISLGRFNQMLTRLNTTYIEIGSV